jgi:hypothetical protein
MQIRKLIPRISLLAALAACADSTEPDSRLFILPDGAVTLTGVIDQPVSSAPAVMIVDARNKPIAGVEVSFTIISGGGSLSWTKQKTSASGRVSVGWTLGKRFGENKLTATVSGLPPVTFTAMAGAPESGIPLFSLVDPAGDTLSQSDTSLPHATDLLSLVGQFKGDALVLTATFSAPMSPQFGEPNFLYGQIEFDIDDNPNTGLARLAHFFGVPGATGIDYTLMLWGGTAGVDNGRVGQPPNPVPVVVTFSGSTVVARVPMLLLGYDDGNFSIAGVFGILDRANDIAWATDIFPNSGDVVAHIEHDRRQRSDDAQRRSVVEQTKTKWR